MNNSVTVLDGVLSDFRELIEKSENTIFSKTSSSNSTGGRCGGVPR